MNPNGIANCMECEAKSIGQYLFSLILGIEKKIQAEKKFMRWFFEIIYPHAFLQMQTMMILHS